MIWDIHRFTIINTSGYNIAGSFIEGFLHFIWVDYLTERAALALFFIGVALAAGCFVWGKF